MNKEEIISTIKMYANKGLEECKDHAGVSIIGAGIGIIACGLAGWNFGAALCVGIVVAAGGCMLVFDKTNPQ